MRRKKNYYTHKFIYKLYKNKKFTHIKQKLSQNTIYYTLPHI